jgi:predicted nucleotidyltransferase
MLNPDFKDMLSALSAEGVEFLVVGAYAMAAHGIPRATGDLDFWVRPSEENARKVMEALERFGAPTQGISVEDFNVPDTVFQIGIAPSRIDLLTAVDGVTFDEAWSRRIHVKLGSVEVPVIGLEELIRNKEAVGRLRDLADVEELQRLRDTGDRG